MTNVIMILESRIKYTYNAKYGFASLEIPLVIIIRKA